jgi:hypothetical protein
VITRLAGTIANYLLFESGVKYFSCLTTWREEVGSGVRTGDNKRWEEYDLKKKILSEEWVGNP